MKFLVMAIKQAKELVRDKQALFFALAFPAIFMLVFGIAFSSDMGGTYSYNVAVVNNDEGIPDFPTAGMNATFGNDYLHQLQWLNYTDEEGVNTSHIFNVDDTLTESEAIDSIQGRALDILIIIPENFSAALIAEADSYVRSHLSTNLDNVTLIAPDINATAIVIINGDPGSQSFYAAEGIAKGVLAGYRVAMKEAFLAQAEGMMYDPNIGAGFMNMTPSEYANFTAAFKINRAEESIVVNTTAVGDTEDFAPFDYIAPGMMVFGVLMSGIGIVVGLTQENVEGTLERLKLTKMKARDMLTGTFITYSVLAAAQVVILFIVAVAVGYNYNTNGSILLAGLIGLFTGMATVALGLVLAAFVKTPEEAGNISPVVMVPLSMMTGAFFPVPNPTLIADFYGKGRDFGMWDILPWRQAVIALSRVLTYGKGIEDVWINIVILLIGSALILGAGIMLYSKKQLRAE